MPRTAARQDAIRPERIRVAAAAAILGVEPRTVQALAARGDLPGAAKIGGLWTFDEAALRAWIKERTTCPKDHPRRSTHTGVETRYGRDLPLQVANSVKACAQALQKLRRGA